MPVATETPRLLLPLTLANGVAVSTLYWGQAVVARAVEQFGPSTTISLMPGATLAGYAAGVAGLATVAGDLTGSRGLAWHFALLAAAACAAATATASAVLTAACFLVGIGCAVTQRLLATATSAVVPARRAETIGWIIAAGLLGIVLARSCVPLAADILGWRGVFWIDAALAALCGWAAASIAARVHRGGSRETGAALPSALSVWRREPTLRHSALQQALVFAAFNMGWAIFPRLLDQIGTWKTASTAAVALLGAAAALASGRLCRSFNIASVARTGAVAVAVASVCLAFGLRSAPWCYLGMFLLDSGTQVALVANQARAQALATTPAMRGRITAIVTTVGFLGGAIGAVAGNLVAWTGLILP